MISFKNQLAQVEQSKVTYTDGEMKGYTVSLVDKIANELNITTKAAKNFLSISLANAMLMDKKQLDYGPRNISSFGTFGVTVRMNDKMERIKTLFNKGRRRRAVNESIQDTFRDISNYAIIALMLELDMWPND